MSWSGGWALLDVQKWLGGPPLCPGVVGMLSVMAESGWEALRDVQGWSGGPPGCPGVVGRSAECPGVVE